MRQDYQLFQQRGVEILAIGPDGPNSFKLYWETEKIPFIGMSDKKSRVADTYYQEVNLLKMGRMPAIFVIDGQGMIRYAHYGDSMSDIPPNGEILNFIDQMSK